MENSDKPLIIEDGWGANGTLEIWPICFSSLQVNVSGLCPSQPFHLFANRVIITVVVIYVMWISAPVLNRLCQNTHRSLLQLHTLLTITSRSGQTQPSLELSHCISTLEPLGML